MRWHTRHVEEAQTQCLAHSRCSGSIQRGSTRSAKTCLKAGAADPGEKSLRERSRAFVHFGGHHGVRGLNIETGSI